MSSNGLPMNVHVFESTCSVLPPRPLLDHLFAKNHDSLGNGTFSDVYRCNFLNFPELLPSLPTTVAVKCIRSWSCNSKKILNEVKCLRKLGDTDNVVKLFFAARRLDNVRLVLEFLDHDKFQSWYYDADIVEVQDYLKNLLIALRHIHKFGVIHRDVKPANFLYNRSLKQYRLVDFGLAQCKKRDLIFTPKKRCSMIEESMENAPLRKRQKITFSPLKEQNVSSTLNTSITKGPVNKLFRVELLSPKQRQRLKRGNNELKATKNKCDLANKRTQSPRAFNLIKQTAACNCVDTFDICSNCLSRPRLYVNKSGTPGYRAPEVLLLCKTQTTAIDLWSAGVVFLSLLSGRHPFFRSRDDLNCLAQLVTLFGSAAVEEAALRLGKSFKMKPTLPALDLRQLCRILRHDQLSKKPDNVQPLGGLCNLCCHSVHASSIRHSMSCLCLHDRAEDGVSGNAMAVLIDAGFDLLSCLLSLDADSRYTADRALNHRFFHSM